MEKSDRIRMEKVSLVLDEEQHRRLWELSQRTRVPLSVYIRAGIDLALRKHQVIR